MLPHIYCCYHTLEHFHPKVHGRDFFGGFSTHGPTWIRHLKLMKSCIFLPKLLYLRYIQVPQIRQSYPAIFCLTHLLLYSIYFFLQMSTFALRTCACYEMYYMKIPGNKAQFLWTRCLNTFIIFMSIRENKVQQWLVMPLLKPQILFWKTIKVTSKCWSVLAESQVSELESKRPHRVSLWSRSIGSTATRPAFWPGSTGTHVMPHLHKRFSSPPDQVVSISNIPSVR